MASQLPKELMQFRQDVEDAKESWTASWTLLNDLEFPLSSKLQGLGAGNRDAQDLNNLVTTILEYVAGAKISKGFSVLLVPDQLLEQLNANAQSLKGSTEQLNQQLEQIRRAGGLQRFDGNQLVATAGNGRAMSLDGLKQIYTGTQALQRAFLAIYPALRSGTAVDLRERAVKLQELVMQLTTELDAAKHQRNVVASLATDAESDRSFVGSLRGESVAASEEITELKDGAEALVAEARAAVAHVRETSVAADTLQKQVDEYTAKLEEFDEALTGRLERLATANEETGAAEQQNKKREAEIDRLAKKADDMMRGATVAGLASSFADGHRVFKDEVKRATWGFWVAIALLTMAVLPLAFYVLEIPGWLKDVLGAEESATTITLEGILARLVLLVPTVWLTRFYARRYAHLFALREEYSHKETLAKSIEGFRKEAPSYQEEITAAVFWDLTRRGKRQSGHDDVPNPVLRRVLDRLEGRVSGQEEAEHE